MSQTRWQAKELTAEQEVLTMARENARKRLARRFGSPERLADMIEVPGWRGIFVEATNIYKYYKHFMKDHKELDLINDIPSVRLPFPETFLELIHGDFGFRIGWAFEEIAPFGETSLAAHKGVADCDPELRDWDMASVGFMFIDEKSFRETPCVMCVFHMDDKGKLVRNPGLRLDDRFQRIGELLGDPLHLAMEALVPILLALSFMNCSNVTLNEVNPNPVINRERRKAGMKPFVRYHTINIEPMKKVLRTEGNIETEGLKKALHICRGHFATYSEEKPLFGKVAGTFWVPAHTRGSLKQGVIVSDYNVKAPNLTPEPAAAACPDDPATGGKV